MIQEQLFDLVNEEDIIFYVDFAGLEAAVADIKICEKIKDGTSVILTVLLWYECEKATESLV